MEKQNLRKQAILEREKISKSVFWQLNDELLAHFITFDWSKINTVHLFLPIVEKREVDTFEFINFFKTQQPHIKIVVPRCDFKTKKMEALVFDAESTVLVKNKQHIPEPLYGENIDPLLIDAVIIPLLAFDKLGHRVGYGAGFYDRFLERCKPDVLKIGVSLFEPIDKILDTHHQDIRLTHCITPKQIYFFD
nr:5-formyltetrahydrofolate cyclo-ligase [uncultured Pedobacter sp.]